jgi:hypothetical protein
LIAVTEATFFESGRLVSSWFHDDLVANGSRGGLAIDDDAFLNPDY